MGGSISDAIGGPISNVTDTLFPGVGRVTNVLSGLNPMDILDATFPGTGQVGRALGGIDTGSAPSVPGLTQEEKDLIAKQGITLDKMNEILTQENIQLSQNRDLLRNFSGLYNSDGSINTAAVDDLRNRTMEQQALAEGISADALNYLKQQFQPSQYQQQSNQIAQQELDRYQNALRGDVPLTEAARQQEQRAFDQLRESAGQRGIQIQGDNVFTATSQSTAGNQLLSNLRSDALKNRQSLSEAELSRGSQLNLSRLGLDSQNQAQLSNLAGSLVQNPGSSQLGFLQNSLMQTPASLLSGYSNLGQAQSSAMQPYSNQRYLNFQNNLGIYGQKQQLFGDLLGLGGTIGTAALFA